VHRIFKIIRDGGKKSDLFLKRLLTDKEREEFRKRRHYESIQSWQKLQNCRVELHKKRVALGIPKSFAKERKLITEAKAGNVEESANEVNDTTIKRSLSQDGNPGSVESVAYKDIIEEEENGNGVGDITTEKATSGENEPAPVESLVSEDSAYTGNAVDKDTINDNSSLEDRIAEIDTKERLQSIEGEIRGQQIYIEQRLSKAAEFLAGRLVNPLDFRQLRLTITAL
jgi:hypothetical protein